MCVSLTHSSPNWKQGFGNTGVSHRITFVLPLCSDNHHTGPVTGPTATPSTWSARYSTRLNLVLPASHSSLPHCRSTLQETEKQRSLPLCQGNSSWRRRALKTKKLLIQVGSTTIIHLGKYFWQVISKSLYFSVPGPLLAIVVVWTIYMRIKEAEEAGAAICFRWTAFRIHVDDYKLLFIGQSLQNGPFWHKDKKNAIKLMQNCLTHGNPSHFSQMLNGVQSMAKEVLYSPQHHHSVRLALQLLVPWLLFQLKLSDRTWQSLLSSVVLWDMQRLPSAILDKKGLKPELLKITSLQILVF